MGARKEPTKLKEDPIRRVVFAEPEQDLIYRELARPFTPAALKWKVQTNPKAADKSALVVGFIDARLVAARLSHVVPGQWSMEYLPVAHAQVGGPEAGKAVLCALTVQGTTRVDVGLLKAGGNADDEVRIKGGYSDAFKRVAVLFGVGASVYAIPKMWMGTREGAKITAKEGSNKFSAYIDNPAAEKYLRGQYKAWLAETGVSLFGEPIDHGDVEGAQGDVEAGDAGGGEGPTAHTEPYGPPAGPDLETKFQGAIGFLEGYSAIKAEDVMNKLQERYGYLPEAAAGALGVYAGLVKAQADSDPAAGDTPTPDAA